MADTQSKERYIQSISKLAEVLTELGEPQQGTSRFFRGHGNHQYKLQPSIYREQYLIENEDKIIRDALTYCPESFSENETLFEKLVKLQHYGYPTRLLDLTEDVLVALYFAVSSSPKETAELIVLDIPDSDVKYADSDTVALLSAVSLHRDLNLECVENRCKEVLEKEQLEMLYKAHELVEKSPDKKEKISKVIKLIKDKSHMHGVAFEKMLEKHNSANLYSYDESFLKVFNDIPEIISLIQIIRMDKPSFLPRIQSNDLRKILCVRAKLNNPRITRQQGLFLLFGIGNNKSEQAENPDWLKSSTQKIRISRAAKTKILKELRSFGITKQYLFPELDSQAAEIKNRYKPKT